MTEGLAAPRKVGEAVQRRLLVGIVACVAAVALVLHASGASGRSCSKATLEAVAPQGRRANPLIDSMPAASPSNPFSNATLAGQGRPPYRLPRLIHQTVKNKSRLSCQQKEAVESWRRLNPGYEHHLWDDEDIRAFVARFYPELVPLPFDQLLTGAERADIWRVLVLHKLGGVYADIDVKCLRPIDEWNADHGHDAQVLLGVENYDASRPHPIHVVNWALASAPGHPLLGEAFPRAVQRAVASQFFAAARRGVALDGARYESGIIDRTGPGALSAALYDLLRAAAPRAANATMRDVDSAAGLSAAGVRVLPVDAMASGWEVAEARRAAAAAAAGRKAAPPPLSCEDLGRLRPKALLCHQFAGSWRSKWQFAQEQTYSGC